jgi:hypothetical protein
MPIFTYPAEDISRKYPRSNFGDLGNLLRVTEFNRRDYRAYVDRTPFHLEDQHKLVGILRHLAIDPEWSLQEVVDNTRFRANSLCTIYHITSINRIGNAEPDGFYRRNVREHWVLLDSFQTFDVDKLKLEDLRSVIPLYSTVLDRGYKHTVEKKPGANNVITDVAIIGLDLVALAVGWWMFMREKREVSTGIASYVCQYPLYQATFYQNQLSVINVLYEFFVKEKDLNDLIITESVTFTTLNEEKLFKQYMFFLIDVLTGRRLQDVSMMLKQIDSLYRGYPYTNYIDPHDQALFAQTGWAFEPGMLKVCAIYLSIANRMKYKCPDINVEFDRLYRQIANRQKNIPEAYFREHLGNLLEEVKVLNDLNSKGVFIIREQT